MMKKENDSIIEHLLKQEQLFETLITNENHTFNEENKEYKDEQFQKKIDFLNKKNSDLESKLIVEKEYTATLINMISNDKLNIKNFDNKYNELSDKSKKIKLSMKNIDMNIQESSRKGVNLNGMSGNLKEEIERMNKLIYMQHNKVGYISQSLDRQTMDIVQDKKIVKDKYLVMEREAKLKKDDIKQMINDAEKTKNIKLNSENRACRIILGLDLIKR